ncbi:hypothetical protein SAMN05216480_12330 [Pustulibacterium marinum]|uniref:Transglutaminase-like superfamily protein n=1 Tax=Pustulibacterium marinum TaxID=1224947 RepID=A0A1I7IWA3_9FLAO|nr:hypothetical protein [Pustulibacterium marinum]SFU77225.1 hypothetical protein SAMN05216480_12330 [Pustulibacterium marinum]
MSNSYVTDEQLNQLSQRSIKSGKEYNQLIPKTYCKGSFSGKGDTSFSVEEIAYMIEQYYWQMEKVAPLLLSSSLNNTSDNIHKFIYWHYQYWADKKTQNLRSPACSWHTRKKGIDCKSYSILAGSILKCLGINFYIRQIKQASYYPEYFTHVYIIVPHNQTSNSLNGGYYVIDGTINPSIETMIVAKKDKFMSGLRHMRLNGVAPANGVVHATPNRRPRGLQITTASPNHGLGLPIATAIGAAEAAGIDTGAIYQSTIGNILANGLDLSCWGASYSESEAVADTDLDLPFLTEQSGINQAVNTNTVNKLMQGLYAYYWDADQGSKKDFASCTKKGHAKRAQITQDYIANIKQQLSQSYQLNSQGVVNGTLISFNLPGYTKGGKFTQGNSAHPYNYEKFTVGNKTTSTSSSSSNGGIISFGGTKNTGTTIGTGTTTATVAEKSNVSEASMGGGVKMVGYALAATAVIVGGKYAYDTYVKPKKAAK